MVACYLKYQLTHDFECNMGFIFRVFLFSIYLHEREARVPNKQENKKTRKKIPYCSRSHALTSLSHDNKDLCTNFNFNLFFYVTSYPTWGYDRKVTNFLINTTIIKMKLQQLQQDNTGHCQGSQNRKFKCFFWDVLTKKFLPRQSY